MASYYVHPNPAVAQAQERARDTALNAVRHGAITWSAGKGLDGGYVYNTGAHLSVPMTLALCELRAARQITTCHNGIVKVVAADV